MQIDHIARRVLLSAWVVFVILYGILGIGSRPVTAATGINHKINFQGKVVNTDGTNVPDATYTFVFNIYSVASGGTTLWTETDSLTTVNGIFQVPLGAVTTLPGSIDFNTDNIYLGMNFNGNGEMTPRVQFSAVPQSFNSEKLGGLDKSGYIQNTSSVQATSNYHISGTGTADTSLVTPLLQSAAATALTITANAASTWSTSAGNLTLQAGSGTVSVGTSTAINSTNGLTITGGSTLNLASTGANAISLDSGTTGTVNIGTGGNDKTINIGAVGSTAVADTVNIATTTGNAQQTVNIGSDANSLSSVTIRAGASYFALGNAGAALASDTNSSTALTVYNVASDALINLNTVSNYVINNGTEYVGNELQNSGFEATTGILTSTSGWVHGTAVNNSAIARSGNNYLAIAANSIIINAGTQKTYSTRTGDQVYVEGYVRTASGTNGTGGLFINFYDEDGNNPVYVNSDWTNPGTSWALRTISTTVPTCGVNICTHFTVDATSRNDSSTGTWYFDDMYLKRSFEQAPMTYKNSTNSTAAFNIQSAGGTSDTLFSANTSNNRLVVGNATSSASTDTTLFVVDSALTSNLPAGVNGGIVYDSSLGKFKVYEGGSYKVLCNTTDLGCASATAGLAKNAVDTSTAAVTATNYLYGFTNSSAAVASGVLKLDNGSNTASTLQVVASGNAAAGSALIFANNTNGTPTGNLIDLQANTTSKFSVTAAGNIAAAGTFNTNTLTSSSLIFGGASGASVQAASGQTLGINAGSTAALNIGTSSNNKTVTIGVDAAIANTTTVNIATSTGAAQTVKIGGTGTASTTSNSGTVVTVQGGAVAATFANAGATLKSYTDTATLFNVQDSGSVQLLAVDSLNKRVYVGSTTPDATGTIFVLDTKNTAAEPTGVLGAMYYNSALGGFRCYGANGWSSCGGFTDTQQLYIRALNGKLYGNFDDTSPNGQPIGTTGNITGNSSFADNYYVRYNTSGTAAGVNAGFNVFGGNYLRTSYDPTCTVRIRTYASANVGARLWIGLFDSTGDLTSAATFPTVSSVAFRYSTVEGDTGFRAVTSNGTSATVNATTQISGVATALDTSYLLKMRVDSTNNTVYFSVNGGAETAVTATLPLLTDTLSPLAKIVSSDTNGDYWYLSRFSCEYGS